MTKPILLSLDEIRERGKPGLSRALTAVEIHDGSDELARLLDDAARNARGFVLGLTGPPGVGKSTLTNALIKAWRKDGLTVGVIAVDPSSRFTRGALLGDRTRLKTDPEDNGIFVRSMAARDRLGGLSDHAIAAIVLMRAVYDRVIVESVGIGQSEADIAFVVDSVVLCIQPGSGDSLQFMKAGVMELPDIVSVTKADMISEARRARADVEGALTLTDLDDAWRTPVVMVSAMTGEGLDDLTQAVDAHKQHLDQNNGLSERRHAQETYWIRDAIRTQFGKSGLKATNVEEACLKHKGPFQAIKVLTEQFRALFDQ